MIIITNKKVYRWNKERFLSHMYGVFTLIVFIVSFLICAYLDHVAFN